MVMCLRCDSGRSVGDRGGDSERGGVIVYVCTTYILGVIVGGVWGIGEGIQRGVGSSCMCVLRIY